MHSVRQCPNFEVRTLTVWHDACSYNSEYERAFNETTEILPGMQRTY
jgi:hypothetical protein